MKKISIVIPCYNEEKSVEEMHSRLITLFQNELSCYEYEIIFVDDNSPDNTWKEIEKICFSDNKTQGIRNVKNFGFTRNVFSSLTYGTGDATFMLFGDLQDPPELLPEFVKQWEEGHKVIIGQRVQGDEGRLMYAMRCLFYKIMDSFSNTTQLPHFNGFGLYDKLFISIIKQLEDSQPYLKGIVSEFSMNQGMVKYHQKTSKRGKSNFNFMRNYDFAMSGITSYTKTLMRLATFVGAGLGILSALYAIFIFINKLLNWDTYPLGTATIIVGIFFIGAIQLFFTGILGEYILSINTRMMKRPLVVVGERLNFRNPEEDKICTKQS